MKNGFVSTIALIAVAAAIAAGVFGFNYQQQILSSLERESNSQFEALWNKISDGQSLFGAFRPSGYTAKLLTRLEQGGAEATFNTTPCTTPDGQTITSNAIGDFVVITVNPGATNEEKISASSVSCSGTTLIWTIANRGLSFASPTTTVAANKTQHAIGERVIISNDDQFTFTQYVSVDDNQTIAGRKTFTLGALFSVAASSTNECDSNEEYCTKLYIDATANAGAATSTQTNGGIVELATALEMASSTNLGTTRPLVLHTLFSTSSPVVGCSGSTRGALCAPIAQNDGTIHPFFIATSTTYTYRWDAIHTFGTTTTFSSAVKTTECTLTDGATVTFNANNCVQGRVVLGGNRTLTITNESVGQAMRLVACSDSSARQISTWDSNVLWPGGTTTPPTPTALANRCDVYSFVTSAATGTTLIFGSIVPF